MAVGLGAWALGAAPALASGQESGTTALSIESVQLRAHPSNQKVRAHVVGHARQCVRLAAAGAIVRNGAASPPTTLGAIVLPPGPETGNIVWAGLYWVVLDDLPPSHTNAVRLNGIPLAPELLPVTASPCWPEDRAYAYFAEVTPLVVGGVNVVTGLDDSGDPGVGPESEGASLIVIYEDATSTACEIIVTDGNDLLNLAGMTAENRLPVSCGSSIPSRLVFVGADGQEAPDRQRWNGVDLGPGDGFAGDDPQGPGAASSGWDTDSWSVLTTPSNVAAVHLPLVGFVDCVNWVATALEVGVRDCAPVSTEADSWGRIKSRYRGARSSPGEGE
jgi:hypothetical protein